MSRLPAAERRAQLLDCAAKLFAERGYARTTTAQLAERAGVTEPVIYRHFDSKLHLFQALIERAGEHTIEMWRSHLQSAATPAERLDRLLGDNPMVLPEGRDAYRVMLQAITEVGDEGVREAVEHHINALHAFLVEEVELARDQLAAMRRFPAEIIAWLLIDVGLGYGVLHAMRIKGQGRSPDGTHVRDVIARLLIGRPNEPRQSAPTSHRGVSRRSLGTPSNGAEGGAGPNVPRAGRRAGSDVES